ncbi:glycerate kinase [Mycobacterium sp. 94-17]|uniref:glycerate kinase family protein n=1 Tax=Mycobacterium sp. 94-17 TaxID=2986147 RepID=UPI002D1E65B8|nr:glycerate kinase [Mycobacterium sp. 94-17]MEB4210724.1 glycerate kinase [Mycobacterium sp. 94-17]
MQVLVAPDCFGETISALEASAAIATGWTRSRPGDRFVVAPQSDGGPGFVEVLASRLGQMRSLRVYGPLKAMVDAEWVFDPASATAYLECAQACGSALIGGPPTPETAMAAHSKGVGQLITEALRVGARRIVVGLGGSACTEGGQGMIAELGGLDAARRKLADVELILASDTEYPLLGPWGAARVFGPQKGADTATVAALEVRLQAWALILEAVAGRDVSSEPGAGAAGGVGAGLLALGGRCESGAAIIAEHTRLSDDLDTAELIVTGEGRFDEQSLHGKVVGFLADAARPRGIPVVVLAGQVDLDSATVRSSGIMAALSIAEHAGSVRLAQADAANQLMGLASVVAARLGNSGPARYR